MNAGRVAISILLLFNFHDKREKNDLKWPVHPVESFHVSFPINFQSKRRWKSKKQPGVHFGMGGGWSRWPAMKSGENLEAGCGVCGQLLSRRAVLSWLGRSTGEPAGATGWAGIRAHEPWMPGRKTPPSPELCSKTSLLLSAEHCLHRTINYPVSPRTMTNLEDSTPRMELGVGSFSVFPAMNCESLFSPKFLFLSYLKIYKQPRVFLLK